jgi:hypothetical protein
MRTLLVCTALLAGCGGDALTCEITGNAIVTGMIGDVEITPVVRAQQVTRPGLGVVLVLDEADGACGEVSSVGEHLVLAFCEAPTPGTHNVVRTGFTCPSSDAFVLVERNGGADYAGGVAGTVTISSTSDGCVTGSFDATMRLIEGAMTDHPISGSFAAVVCP